MRTRRRLPRAKRQKVFHTICAKTDIDQVAVTNRDFMSTRPRLVRLTLGDGPQPTKRSRFRRRRSALLLSKTATSASMLQRRAARNIWRKSMAATLQETDLGDGI